ncbi:serine hydrolase [Candidatus Parcubacteria bacterium]|nr:serine hydrolase [Candidatus Parcubacteria bacterium]
MLTNKQELKFFVFLGTILFVLLVVSFIFGHRVRRENISSPSKVAVENPFDKIHISAKAAYVFDVRTGEVLYEKNADTRLPLASLTKVMTALVATELAPTYSVVTVTKEAIATEGDSGLQLGEHLSLKDILDFSLTGSSNDGVRAVSLAFGALGSSTTSPEAIENDFIRDMNKKADEINMKNTYFFNVTGLDETDHKGGAYGSAKDMALLFTYILKNHPELMAATRKPFVAVMSEEKNTHVAKNTDTIINSIPGVKASKTGFTDLAGGNLVVAFDPEIGRPIVISVLGSTEEGRFQDMQRLVAASLKAIQK